jgi:hypothetical protein
MMSTSRPSRCWSFPLLLLLGASAACSSSDDGSPPPSTDGPPEGYVRFETPPMSIGPGETKQYVHWVHAAFDHDQDIVDVVGAQGPGGHHAILYTTREIQPVGTTREFANADQADIQFVGGLGGEGGAGVKLPAGVVFRVPAGRGLLVQTHYFNAGDTPIEGRSHLDVKFAEPAPTDVVARFFASALPGVMVAPHLDSTLDTSCVLAHDLPMLMFSNHMHELGVSIRTSLTLADGSVQVLKDDPSWNPEWIFNPDYTMASVASPTVLPAGSTLTTTCAWHNPTDEVWADPDEMCVFFGFFLGDKDVVCAGGHWIE